MGEGFEDCGEVKPPAELKKDWEYLVGCGDFAMVQTFALDILALATRGRVTPLRLWKLAQWEQDGASYLDDFNYGKIAELQQQTLDTFEWLTKQLLSELEDIGDVEIAKQRLLFDGLLWLWIAPDR